MNELDLELLVDQLIEAKAAETKARNLRCAIEEEIAGSIPGPDSGQKSVTLEDGTKVTVKRGWNYKCDHVSMLTWFEDELREEEPAPLKSKTTVELDEKGYNWYRENHPHVFNSISKFVEAKPKKVSVEVKRK